MKDIYMERFLVWLMWLVPIALTGWGSVIVWTAIQLILCCRDEERRERNQKNERERIKKKKELEDENIKRQIALAEEWGKDWMVINGEVKMYDRK